MADVAENTSYADAATAISQGKRHLLVQDYTAAVTAFAEGLEMMSQKLSDCDDELGEPYLLYGRALLGLAREEAGVLGGGVPGSEDAEEDEDGEEEDGEDEKLSDVDEKGEESEETDDKKQTTEPSVETTENKTDPEEKKEEKIEKDEKQPEKDEKQPEKDEKQAKKEEKPTSNETDDKKIEEQKLEKGPEKVTKPEVENVAGSSKVHANGSASNAEKGCNGTAGKSDEVEDEEDVNKEDEEEDPGRGIDLQVAWEVLELAKIVFTKRGEAGLKNLAETHRLLGEVAMESDNPQGAITDLEGALKLLQKMEPCEPRAIAEIHYQLGLAHSLLNDFDASIGQFKEATTLLEARIKQLDDIKEPPKSDDPFYTVEGEIKELKELLPAIQEKITDMKDFKEEACRLVIEGIKNKVAGGCTNGAGSSNDGASSSSQTAVSPKNDKPVSDISHLVRKKRKAEESESPAQSPCKKPTP